jgi:hypothetical protein
MKHLDTWSLTMGTEWLYPASYLTDIEILSAILPGVKLLVCNVGHLPPYSVVVKNVLPHKSSCHGA